MTINVILKKNVSLCNLKIHSIFTECFSKYYNILNLDEHETIEFIKNNNNSNTKIIIYFDIKMDSYHVNVLNFIQNNENYSKIYFIVFDWWKVNFPGHDEQNYVISNIFKANNYKVITIAYDIEQLNKFHGADFNEYKNNIIHFNFNSAYDLAFSPFNNNPIEKILVSGQIYEIHYPERSKMLLMDNIEHYQYNMNDVNNKTNNYNKTLNNYLCCFTSSVYIYNSYENKILNTNMILYKTYEILASGSLLVMPLTEEKFLNQIGIINGENCLLIDFEKDLNEQINTILDINNRNYINKIRYNGYTHVKNNLNTEHVFNELKKILET
jgi:hypothetical protein